MSKICGKCQSTMSYDPYFKAYICRQCGCSHDVMVRSVPTYTLKRLERKKSESNILLVAAAK
jgi:hypothetical protein